MSTLDHTFFFYTETRLDRMYVRACTAELAIAYKCACSILSEGIPPLVIITNSLQLERVAYSPQDRLSTHAKNPDPYF